MYNNNITKSNNNIPEADYYKLSLFLSSSSSSSPNQIRQAMKVVQSREALYDDNTINGWIIFLYT